MIVSIPLLSKALTIPRLAPSRATGIVPRAAWPNAALWATCAQLANQKSMLSTLRLCAIVLACAVSSYAAEPTPHDLVAQANKALTGGDTVKALHLYDEAEKLLPDSPQIAYNRGVAQYRKGDYEKATELFTKALATRDLSLDAKARFNLGNCAYASALKMQSDLPKAIDKLGEAIVRYREALEANPDDMDARANIERAQLLIKDLIDKEKQRQEQEKQQKEDQQKQDQTSKPSEDQQPSSQPSQQPESQPGSKDKQEQQQQDQQQKDESQQGKQDKQDAQSNQKKEGKPEAAEQQGGSMEKDQQQQEKPQTVPATQQTMTPEEAQRLLQSIRDKEQQRREEQAKRLRIIQVPVDKDW